MTLPLLTPYTNPVHQNAQHHRWIDRQMTVSCQ